MCSVVRRAVNPRTSVSAPETGSLLGCGERPQARCECPPGGRPTPVSRTCCSLQYRPLAWAAACTAGAAHHHVCVRVRPQGTKASKRRLLEVLPHSYRSCAVPDCQGPCMWDTPSLCRGAVDEGHPPKRILLGTTSHWSRHNKRAWSGAGRSSCLYYYYYFVYLSQLVATGM